MAEPKRLQRGKRFHKRVQRDWEVSAQGDPVREYRMPLLRGRTATGRRRHGYVDVFIDEDEGLVTIVEIKGTDWDRILPRNVQKNLSAHRRQVWKYIEKYVEGEGMDVCAGIIYPRAPRTVGLKDRIEGYLNDYGLQVVWYHD